MLRVGLTGGIASGKTTIANMFGELGAVLIDSDLIAREVVEPDTPGLQKVVDEFGASVVAPGGRLDRRRLREIVFADDDARRKLEAILHPLIRDEIRRRMRELDGPYQIVVVPLLVESPIRDSIDRVLVVDCAEDVQLARLLERDAESREQAVNMIAAQASRDERLAIADDVIDNGGTLDAARSRVQALHERYLALSESREN